MPEFLVITHEKIVLHRLVNSGVIEPNLLDSTAMLLRNRYLLNYCNGCIVHYFNNSNIRFDNTALLSQEASFQARRHDSTRLFSTCRRVCTQ